MDTKHGKRPPGGKGRPPRLPLGFVLLAVLLILILIPWLQGLGQKKLAYSDVMDILRAQEPLGEDPAGKKAIQEISIGEVNIAGGYREPPPEGEEGGALVAFHAVRPPRLEDDDLLALAREKKVRIKGEPPSGMTGLVLLFLLPVLLLVGFWIFGMRRMGSMGQQIVSFGRSKAKIVAEKDTRTTFEDIAGCEEAKEELKEIIAYLREPRRFRALGARIPKGVLLVGLPGTGKTLMARGVAGEAGVPFYSLSGSDFVEMFVGVGAARVRDLFNRAKSKPPCIVFIDEIDAVGRHRGAGLGGGHDEREQTLNALLVELDGFEANQGVVIIAATNRPDVLDPALLRPGRFDRQVVLDPPEAAGREAILDVHGRDKPLAGDVDLSVLARRTPGFTGADLANVMNEAALLAGRKGLSQITMVELEEAIDRVVAGPERKSRLIGSEEKRIIAYHEVGHALTASRLPHADRVHKVSIVPRGRVALGFTLQIPEEDVHLVTRSQLMDRISVSLGGRVAEELVIGDVSTGAQSDLEHVADLARSMVCRFGMSEALGPIALERSDGATFLGKELVERKSQYSPQTLERIDQEIARVVEKAYSRTREILGKNRDLMDRLAARLMEEEIMDGKDFAEVIRKDDEAKGPPEHDSQA